MDKSKKILADHKRKGKKFIPPLMQLPGGMHFVKWLDHTLPEILWIGLLQEKVGIKRSIEICCVIANAAKDIRSDQDQSLSFAFTSNYKRLTDDQGHKLREILKEKAVLQELLFSLDELIKFYPDCPLKILLEKNYYSATGKLEEFKQMLDKYFYRAVHLTNVMEGTALCMSILAGHVLYVHNATMPDLDSLIKELPGTPQYERTASSVRASTLSLIQDIDSQWCKYFWKRGLEIDRCQK